MLICTLCRWLCEDQIPEITELEKGGLCDVQQGECSTLRINGHGFKDSYELKCEFVKEKVLYFSFLDFNTRVFSRCFFLCLAAVFDLAVAAFVALSVLISNVSSLLPPSPCHPVRGWAVGSG